MTSKHDSSNSDGFSFEKYISGVSTFPTFDHTVYPDQANGVALQKVYAELREIQDEGNTVEREIEAESDAAVRSLDDDTIENLVTKRDELLDRAKVLSELKVDLEQKVRGSATTLHFQVGTAQKLGSVIRRAEKEYEKKHGRLRADDMEYMSGKLQHQLEAQLEAYCVSITLNTGETVDPPNRAGFTMLLNSLIPSESARLLTALGNGLDSSTEWAEKLDAGFPGGGTVETLVPVGDSGNQGVEGVGNSPDDHADGGSI